MLYVLIALNVLGTAAIVWAAKVYQRRFERLQVENTKLKRYLSAVDTTQFMVKQQSKKIQNLIAALNYARIRLDRDIDKESMDKIASGEPH